MSAPFTVKAQGTAQLFEGEFVLKRLEFKIGEGAWSDTEASPKACTDYATSGGSDYCTVSGGYSDGWNRDSLGPFAKYARDGVDAREACCACGGGEGGCDGGGGTSRLTPNCTSVR